MQNIEQEFPGVLKQMYEQRNRMKHRETINSCFHKDAVMEKPCYTVKGVAIIEKMMWLWTMMFTMLTVSVNSMSWASGEDKKQKPSVTVCYTQHLKSRFPLSMMPFCGERELRSCARFDFEKNPEGKWMITKELDMCSLKDMIMFLPIIGELYNCVFLTMSTFCMYIIADVILPCFI